MSSTPTCTLTACWSWYNVKGQAGVLIQTARWMTGSPSYFFYGPFSLQTWPFGWQPREEHFTGVRRVTPGKMKGYRERGCEGWKKNAASIISQMSQAAFQRRENLHFRLLLRMTCTHRLCHILHIIHTKVEAFNTRCLFFFYKSAQTRFADATFTCRLIQMCLPLWWISNTLCYSLGHFKTDSWSF